MKFTCATRHFADAIKTASRANPAKAPNGISGIFLRVTGYRLEACASNGDISIVRSMMVSDSEDGETMIPDNYLQEITARLNGEMLTFRFDAGKNVAYVEAGAASVKLVTINKTGFFMPALQKSIAFSVDGARLASVARKVIFACDRGADIGLKPIFSGCFLTITDGKATLVGTNTHRLAIETFPVECETNLAGAIIPAAAMGEAARIAKDDPGKMTVRIDLTKVEFRMPNTVLVASLISGKYPDFKRVVPATCKTAAIINKEEFMGALDRMTVIAKSMTSVAAQFAFKDEAVTCTSANNAVGESQEAVRATISGEPITIAFNTRYLGEVLRVAEGEKFNIEMSEPLRPAKITDDDAGFAYIITPVRMK